MAVGGYMCCADGLTGVNDVCFHNDTLCFLHKQPAKQITSQNQFSDLSSKYQQTFGQDSVFVTLLSTARQLIDLTLNPYIYWTLTLPTNLNPI